jgi:hypothetical protein
VLLLSNTIYRKGVGETLRFPRIGKNEKASFYEVKTKLEKGTKFSSITEDAQRDKSLFALHFVQLLKSEPVRASD